MNNLLIQIHDGKFGADRSYRSPKQKRGRRSFKETAGIGGCRYFGRQRIGPEKLQFPDNLEKDFLFGDREKANFLWCLLRYCSSPKQTVPSWTRFNISLHEGTPILQSRIHYLDRIDAPTMETSTIYQVCLAIRFSKNRAILFFSSASMKRILLNYIPAQDGIGS